MSKINTRGIYNAALDGLGLVFKGSPETPAYSQRTAAVFQNRFAQGDRSEADFSFWWYWSESQWDRGFQEQFYSAGEGGYFKSGNNIDVIREPGKILSLVQPATVGTISAGTTAVIPDSINWGAKMLFPINKASGTATLYSLSTADVLTDQALPGGAGPVINQMDVFSKYVYMAMGTPTLASAIIRMDAAGNFSIPAGFTTIGSARAVCSVGPTLYIAYASPTAGSGDIITYTQDDAAFVTAVSFTGQNRKVSEGNMVPFNSMLHYLIQEGNKVELWQYVSGVATKIYTWPNLPSPKLSVLLSNLIISGVVNSKTIEFFYDGNNVYSAFEQLPITSGIGSSKFYESFGVGFGDGLMATMNDDSDTVFLPGFNFLTNGTRGIPIGSFNGFVYFNSGLDSAGSLVLSKASQMSGTSYLTSGSHLITSPIHTGQIPDVDKIYHDSILRFEPLSSGQKIIVEYSTDPYTDDTLSTWTTLGSADFTIDGAITSKRLSFPLDTAVISKHMKHRLNLVPGSGASVKLQDIVFRYLPMPYYPHEWAITVNAGDEVQLLNRQLDTKTGRKIRNQLQISFWKNQLVDWQDIDYASTKMTSALNATGTIINVLDTNDYAEAGRIVADNETIFYTSKTPTSFNGLTRGARGSTAVAHGSATIVDNAYKVLITDVQSRVPILANGLKVEYATTVTFREDI